MSDTDYRALKARYNFSLTTNPLQGLDIIYIEHPSEMSDYAVVYLYRGDDHCAVQRGTTARHECSVYEAAARRFQLEQKESKL